MRVFPVYNCLIAAHRPTGDTRPVPQTRRTGGTCWPHGIRRRSLFGSAAKGTAQPDSDADLLVEFAPGATPSFLDIAGIEAELSAPRCLAPTGHWPA